MADNFLPALDAAALPPGRGETVKLAGRRIVGFNLGVKASESSVSGRFAPARESATTNP